ncbi:hypothetical protein Mapa_016620 [Marchantia paleacea]|nr:hypothetical protein Mapa_016620 [Marchantia paleacea]
MGMIICEKCSRRFETSSAYNQHCADSHKVEPQRLKCIYGCERLFRDVEAMNKHKEAKHAEGVDEFVQTTTTVIPPQKMLQFVCEECGVDFETLANLRAHQVDRQDGEHIRISNEIGSKKCESCDKVFDCEDSLEQHFVSNHAVIQLPPTEKRRISVERKFFNQWKKGTTVDITVQSVFKIYNSAWRAARYAKYRSEIEANSRGQGDILGNEHQLFHGTSLACELGSPSQGAKLCNLNNCNMCSILRRGFKLAKAATNKWQRYGRGIYTTPTSGKSDDYIPATSERRAVFVCKVLTGKQYRTKTNYLGLTSPPQGFDSVWGEPGVNLNYDEVVVYNSRAILPSYIIVYTKKSNHQPQRSRASSIFLEPEGVNLGIRRVQVFCCILILIRISLFR